MDKRLIWLRLLRQLLGLNAAAVLRPAQQSSAFILSSYLSILDSRQVAVESVFQLHLQKKACMLPTGPLNFLQDQACQECLRLYELPDILYLLGCQQHLRLTYANSHPKPKCKSAKLLLRVMPSTHDDSRDAAPEQRGQATQVRIEALQLLAPFLALPADMAGRVHAAVERVVSDYFPTFSQVTCRRRKSPCSVYSGTSHCMCARSLHSAQMHALCASSHSSLQLATGPSVHLEPLSSPTESMLESLCSG